MLKMEMKKLYKLMKCKEVYYKLVISITNQLWELKYLVDRDEIYRQDKKDKNNKGYDKILCYFYAEILFDLKIIKW